MNCLDKDNDDIEINMEDLDITDKMKGLNLKKNVFEEYWDEKNVLEEVKKGTVVKKRLRINQRNNKMAFLTDLIDMSQPDIYVDGFKNRNRALNGDIVGARLNFKYFWNILEIFKKNVKSTVQSYIVIELYD